MHAVSALLFLAVTTTLGAVDVSLGHRDFVPTPERPVGWRGDGTGRFPGATPVTDWDLETGKNVVWKRELGFFSCSSPIVVGDKVFTTAEPDELICCDANNGEILWTRHLDPRLAKLPVADREEVYRQYRRVAEDAEAFLRLASGERMVQGTGVSNGNYAELQKQAAKAVGRSREEINTAYATLYNKRGARNIIGNGWWWYHGNTWPTPASDGTVVVVKMGGHYVGWNVLACFDLKGNLRWQHDIGDDDCWGANCASPLIVGDLVVSLTVPEGSAQGTGMLTAFDLQNGRPRWSVPCGITTASPIRVKVGGVDVVVAGSAGCGGGYKWVNRTGGHGPQFVRARDGKVLLENLDSVNYRLCTPTWEGDVLVIADNPAGSNGTDKRSVTPHRFRLSLAKDELKVEALGPCLPQAGDPAEQAKKGRKWDWDQPRGSFLLADGILYKQIDGLVPTFGVHDTRSGTWKPLVTIDGALHAGVEGGNEHPCGRGTPSDNYASAALGGRYVFGCPSSYPSQFGVITHGPDPQVVGKPVVASNVNGNPFFQGGRIYVRDHHFLYCFGKR